MSESEDNPPTVGADENLHSVDVADHLNEAGDSVPVFESYGSYERLSAPGSFVKPKTVHEFLGGGKVADILLWREKFLSAGILASATLAWIMFHWLQFKVLSVASNVLLLGFVVLFAWSVVSSLLNRPPPPIPKIRISEDLAQTIARTVQIELNTHLRLLHSAALGKDVKLFLKVSAGLWFMSIAGGWFSSLTLLFCGVVAALTFFVVYDKYEYEIDKYSRLLLSEAMKQYRKIDELVLSKIPKGPRKDRKSE